MVMQGALDKRILQSVSIMKQNLALNSRKREGERERVKERERDGEKEMERKGEGPTRILCWMRATELKIVGERERQRTGVRERGRSRFMHQRLI